MPNHVAGAHLVRRRYRGPTAVALTILLSALIAGRMSMAHFRDTDVVMAPPIAVPIDMPAPGDPAAPIVAGRGQLRTPSTPSTPTSQAVPHVPPVPPVPPVPAVPAVPAMPAMPAADTHPHVRPRPVARAYKVRYSFDGGVRNLPKSAGGGPRLVELTAGGGALSTVSHHGGDAIGFPRPCARPDRSSCPRAILETFGDVAALNPRTGTISYGATVRMTKMQTSDGENIVQKGFATGGSEYKLQVDGDAGRPSCAVVGTASPTIYLIRASISVDDGAWHDLSCDLTSGELTVSVDGVVRGARSVPAGMKISNDDPVRIGGKGRSANNDQFHGALDDVWISVQP